jgi:hypothetical protein
MAEVAPLLTPQGWQLVTPVAASGAATGGAVGGVAGLALAAAGVGVLALAFLMARRASRKAAAAAKGKPASKQPGGATGKQTPAAGLLSRIPRPGSKTASTGAAGGSRTGGGSRGRMWLPGRGGTGAAGGGRSAGSAGGPRKGTGRLAGLRSRLGGRGTAGGGKSGSGASGGKTGRGAGGSKAGGPGLLQRARNIGRARRVADARARKNSNSEYPKMLTSGVHPPRARRTGGVRKGFGYLTKGRKPTSPAAPKTGPKGGKIGPAGENHGKGIRGVVSGIPGALRGVGRAGRNSKPGSFSPINKREQLAARGTAGGDTTPAGRRGTSAVARRAIDNATSTPVGKRRRTMGGTMPIIRRPQINKTGLARSSASQLGSAPASGRTPFAPVIEACGQAARGYSPDNAQRAIEWYEGMPQLIEAIAAMFAAHAEKNAEDFYLYPAAAEIANALGTKFLAYRGPCDDARSAFEAAHAEDLAKLRDPKRHQEKWDILVNRD